MIEQVNRTAASKSDPVSLLAEVIRVITDEGADPYLVFGVLVEGTVNTVASHIPAERQVQVTEEVGRLLRGLQRGHGRLVRRANGGTIPQPEFLLAARRVCSGDLARDEIGIATRLMFEEPSHPRALARVT